MSTLVRSVMAAAHGRFDPNDTTELFIKRRWGGSDMQGIATMLRAASAPAMTSTVGWAKELAPVTTAFLSNLVPFSAGADLLQRATSLSLDGVAAINIPNITTPLADFVAPGAPIPVIMGTASIQASLEPHKFACIVALSREVVEHANGEVLTRQALNDAMGPSLDRRLFDSNAAVADLRPAGLLFGKSALTPSADTDKVAAMIADLSALAAAVAPYAGNGGIVFVGAARQVTAATIGLLNFPYPLLASTTLPAGTVICVAVNALVSALGAAPTIDLTKAATLQMSDTPQAIATGGTMAGPTIATFQDDVVGIRLRFPLSWALRNANAIAFMSAVTW